MNSIVFGEIIMKKINMKSIVFGEIIMKKIKMKKRFGFIGTLMVAIFALTGIAHAQAVDPNNLIFPIGEGKLNWDSYHAFAKAHDYTGQKLTMTSRLTGTTEDRLENMLAYFAKATGAEVVHQGSQTFKQDVVANLEGGSPANITAFALPGFARDMLKRGFLTPLCEDPNNCQIVDWQKKNYANGDVLSDLATWKGPDGKEHFYGVPYFNYIKSIIWYVPENFEDMGYRVPRTEEELRALEQQIIADGETPWCAGMFANGSTGWPAQDTLEDIILRDYPVEVYDKWVTNEIKMDDPRIVAALEKLGKRLLDPKMVSGGPKEVNALDWRVAAAGIFADPPKCFMYTQGTYLASLFPEGKVFGDWNFFYIPVSENRCSGCAKKPVNFGGSFWTITKDSPVTRGFIEWLKTPIAHELYMAQGGFITPHKHVNPDVYADPALRKMSRLLLSGEPLRFDGADDMPGAIGGVALNRGMIDYIGGKSAKEVLSGIQEVWDKL